MKNLTDIVNTQAIKFKTLISRSANFISRNILWMTSFCFLIYIPDFLVGNWEWEEMTNPSWLTKIFDWFKSPFSSN